MGLILDKILSSPEVGDSMSKSLLNLQTTQIQHKKNVTEAPPEESAASKIDDNGENVVYTTTIVSDKIATEAIQKLIFKSISCNEFKVFKTALTIIPIKNFQNGMINKIFISATTDTFTRPLMFNVFGLSCAQNRIQFVKFLIENKSKLFLDVKVGCKKTNEFSAFSIACASGSIDVVQELLKVKEIDVNFQTDENDFTPLIQAIFYKRVEVVKLLVSNPCVDVNKSIINRRQRNRCSPLLLASGIHDGKINKDILKMLLSRDDIDVNNDTPVKNMRVNLFSMFMGFGGRGGGDHVKNDEDLVNQNPLTFAIRNNAGIEVVKMFLKKKKFKFNYVHEGPYQYIRSCVVAKSFDVFLELLKRDNFFVNGLFGRQNKLESPFSMLCKTSPEDSSPFLLKIIKYFLNRNDIDVNTGHPLLKALVAQNMDIFKLLLSSRTVDVNLDNPIIGVVCCNGFIEYLTELFKHPEIDINKSALNSIDRNIQDNTEFCREYCSPLCDAIYSKQRKNKMKIVKMLLSRDDIDVNNVDKLSTLHNCIRMNELEIFKLLLKRDDIDINKGIVSPLYYAIMYENTECIKILLKRKDLNVNSGKISSLFVACLKGNMDVVKILIGRKEIDVNAGDANPLYGAIMNGNDKVIKRLLGVQELDVNRISTIHPSLLKVLYIKNFDVFPVKMKFLENDKTKFIPFGRCVMTGNIDLIKLLITSSENIDINYCDQFTPLFYSILLKRFEIFELLINHNDINVIFEKEERDYFSIDFTIAALLARLKDNDSDDESLEKRRNEEILRKIFFHKSFIIKVNGKEDCIKTPFARLCRFKSNEIISCVPYVQKLMKIKGFDVNSGKISALNCAIVSKNVEVTKLLLKMPNIDVNKGIPFKKTISFEDIKKAQYDGRIKDLEVFTYPLSSLCWYWTKGKVGDPSDNDIVEVIKGFFTKDNVDINVGDEITPLSALCFNPNEKYELVKLFLDHPKVDVNKGRWSPLFFACFYGHIKIFRELLKRKEIDINHGSIPLDFTPFYMSIFQYEYKDSVRQKRKDVIFYEMLRRKDLKPNKGKESVLKLAVENRDLTKIQDFVNMKEIEIDKMDPSGGLTAFQTAIVMRNTLVAVKLLERNDLNVNIKNILGVTALYGAVEKKVGFVIDFILLRKNFDKRIGSQALVPAIVTGNVKLFRRLLYEKKFDVNVICAKQTPLTASIMSQNYEIFMELLRHKDIDVNIGTISAITISSGIKDERFFNALISRKDINLNGGLLSLLQMPISTNMIDRFLRIYKNPLLDINHGVTAPLASASFMGLCGVDLCRIMLKHKLINVNVDFKGSSVIYKLCKDVTWSKYVKIGMFLERSEFLLFKGDLNPVLALCENRNFFLVKRMMEFLVRKNQKNNIFGLSNYLKYFIEPLEYCCKKEYNDLIILFLYNIDFDLTTLYDFHAYFIGDPKCRRNVIITEYFNNRSKFRDAYGKYKGKYYVGINVIEYYKCAFILGIDSYENFGDSHAKLPSHKGCIEIERALKGRCEFDFVCTPSVEDNDDINDEFESFIISCQDKVKLKNNYYKKLLVFIYVASSLVYIDNMVFIIDPTYKKKHLRNLKKLRLQLNSSRILNSLSSLGKNVTSIVVFDILNPRDISYSVENTVKEHEILIKKEAPYKKEELHSKESINKAIFRSISNMVGFANNNKSSKEEKESACKGGLVMLFSHDPNEKNQPIVTLADCDEQTIFSKVCMRNFTKYDKIENILYKIRRECGKETHNKVIPLWNSTLSSSFVWNYRTKEGNTTKIIVGNDLNSEELKWKSYLDYINIYRKYNSIQAFESRTKCMITYISEKKNARNDVLYSMGVNVMDGGVITSTTTTSPEITSIAQFTQNIFIIKNIATNNMKIEPYNINTAVITHNSVLYYEVIILEHDSHRSNYISIGLSMVGDTCIHVGYSPDTVGYVSNGSVCNSYCYDGIHGKYGKGDVVGCGMNLGTGEVFFTLNGDIFVTNTYLPLKGRIINDESKLEYYPTITFMSPSVKIERIVEYDRFSFKSFGLFFNECRINYKEKKGSIVFHKGAMMYVDSYGGLGFEEYGNMHFTSINMATFPTIQLDYSSIHSVNNVFYYEIEIVDKEKLKSINKSDENYINSRSAMQFFDLKIGYSRKNSLGASHSSALFAFSASHGESLFGMFIELKGRNDRFGCIYDRNDGEILFTHNGKVHNFGGSVLKSRYRRPFLKGRENLVPTIAFDFHHSVNRASFKLHLKKEDQMFSLENFVKSKKKSVVIDQLVSLRASPLDFLEKDLFFLIEKGDLNEFNTIITIIKTVKGDLNVCELLISYGKQKRLSLLSFASVLGKIDFVRYLLRRMDYLKGKSGNEKGFALDDALYYSCVKGNYEIVKEILKNVPVNSQTYEFYYKSFSYICQNGLVDFVKLFVQRNIPIKIINEMLLIKGGKVTAVHNLLRIFIKNKSKVRFFLCESPRFSIGIGVREYYKAAFIIGNEEYTTLVPLKTSINDSKEVKSLLQGKCSFDYCQTVVNVTMKSLMKNLEKFLYEISVNMKDEKNLYKEVLICVYYSGHGLSYSSISHILPIEFKVEFFNDPENINKHCLSEEYLEKFIERHLHEKISNKISCVVVLDACRDVVNENMMDKSEKKHKMEKKGMQEKSQIDYFYVYSTNPNKKALDSVEGKGNNSPFTLSVMNILKEKGDLNELLNKIVEEVEKETFNNQKPWMLNKSNSTLIWNGYEEVVSNGELFEMIKRRYNERMEKNAFEKKEMLERKIKEVEKNVNKLKKKFYTI